MNKICCENGVFFVNDLISENKMLFTYEEFKNHYNIRLNFIEYFSILSFPVSTRINLKKHLSKTG
jgi:hypothetical protein